MFTICRPDKKVLEELVEADSRISYCPFSDEDLEAIRKEIESKRQYWKRDGDFQSFRRKAVELAYSWLIDNKVITELMRLYSGRNIGYRGVVTATCDDFGLVGDLPIKVKNINNMLRDGTEYEVTDPREIITSIYFPSSFEVPHCWVTSSFIYVSWKFRKNAPEGSKQHIFPALLIYDSQLIKQCGGFSCSLPQSIQERSGVIMRVYLFDYLEPNDAVLQPMFETASPTHLA